MCVVRSLHTVTDFVKHLIVTMSFIWDWFSGVLNYLGELVCVHVHVHV